MKLEVKNLVKRFGEAEILHGISFEVKAGKALGLLGRNGAGKTTTIRILMDVFRGNSGEILIDGEPFERSKYRIGYLPEERGLYPKKTVIEQIVYLGKLRGISAKEAKANAKKWLKKLDVIEYENKKLETLSKGNQQKVQLASTLVNDPEILILDEPFSGLDPVNSQILKDVIIELIKEDRLVIFSSHQMSYVEDFCDEIAIINKGEVVLDGSLKDIKKEFGKGRIIVGADNYSLTELRNIIEKKWSNMLKVEHEGKEWLVCELGDKVSKNQILSSIMDSDIELAAFGNYQPTLNDIFVEKAGDNNE